MNVLFIRDVCVWSQAFQYDNNEMNTKYAVLQILHDKMLVLPEADGTLTAKSLQDFA